MTQVVTRLLSHGERVSEPPKVLVVRRFYIFSKTSILMLRLVIRQLRGLDTLDSLPVVWATD